MGGGSLGEAGDPEAAPSQPAEWGSAIGWLRGCSEGPHTVLTHEPASHSQPDGEQLHTVHPRSDAFGRLKRVPSLLGSSAMTGKVRRVAVSGAEGSRVKRGGCECPETSLARKQQPRVHGWVSEMTDRAGFQVASEL